MLRYSMSCILMALSGLLTGQYCNLDSLKVLLPTLPKAEEKVSLLYKITVCYDYGNQDSAYHYATKAAQLSDELANEKWICRSNTKYGTILARMGRFDEAETSFTKCDAACKTDEERSKMYNNRAIFYSTANRIQEGIADQEKSLAISVRTGNENSQAKTLMNLATSYARITEFAEALRYATDALEINEKIQQPENLAFNYTLLSSIYRMLEDQENGLRFLNKAIALNEQENRPVQLARNYFTRGKLLTQAGQIEEAVTSLREAAAIMEANNNLRHLVTVQSELADRLIELDRLEEALPLLNDCISGAETVGNLHTLVQGIATRGLLYAKRSAYRTAYADAERSLALSHEYDLPFDRQIAYQLYSYLDSLTNHPLQANRLREHMALKDTLQDLAETEKIAELRTQLATAEKEKEVALLTKDNEQKDALAGTQQVRIRWAIAGLLLLLALAATLYAQRQKLSRVKLALEQSLVEKEVLLREIHHRVKNNLQLIMSLLNLQAAEGEEQDLEEFLDKGQHRVQAISLIHEQLYRSDDVADIDMQHYSEQLLQSIEDSYGAASVDYSVRAEKVHLDIDQAVPLGIIINELVTNSLKHAFPGRERGSVRVSLQGGKAAELELRVEDDGVGHSKTTTTGSLGLQLVELLVQQLRGTLSIDAEGGTSVSIRFPKTA